MSSIRALLFVLMIIGMSATRGGAQATKSPWGISSSASSFRNHAEWFPKMAEAGISTVRLFPSWRGFEPKKGTWRWEQGDALLRNAAKNNIEISAILMGSSPGTKAVHRFPVDDLQGWSNYVNTLVNRYKKQIRYWEVWNEGNGSFNDGKHTTSDYAKLAVTAYEAAKKADAKAQVGLTVASFDAPYLHQTILAMKKAGKPDSFDYLCIHPYEIADNLDKPDGEIPFLWMTKTLRDMLKLSAPKKKDSEIWITEVSRRVEQRNNQVVTEQDAAKALAKIYIMAIAQGIACTQWFEAQDPRGEPPGFGLLKRDGSERASYKTMKTMTTLLGAKPHYEGWLALGREKRGYGFVIKGRSEPVLIAWMPAGMTDDSLSFAGDVKVTKASTSTTTTLKAGERLKLTDEPVFIVGIPAELVEQARAQAKKPFPWGGDYSKATTVSFEAGIPDARKGLFPVGNAQRPRVKFADGTSGLVVPGDIGNGLPLFVHPSFAGFQQREYYVRVTVRRMGSGNVGMNLIYQVADGQGRTPYKNVGRWFGATKSNDWQTYTWHVTDACLTKMWGYDIIIRPEESIPFAIGKVEVSTKPFN